MSGAPLKIGLQTTSPAAAKQAALEALLEKTRAEFLANYGEGPSTQGVWDDESAEIVMAKQFHGLTVDPDTSDPGEASASVATVRSAGAGVASGEGVALDPGVASASVATVRSAGADVAPGESVVAVVPFHKNNRTCTMCGVVGHWRKMRREMKIDHWQQFKHESEDTYYEVQTCMKCVGVEMGIPEKEAQAIVLAGPIAHKKARYENMMEGKAMAAIKISGMASCSRTERRELTMNTMIELFGPLAKHIVRKQQALQKVHTDTLRHKELAEKLAECSDFESEQEILKEMEGLEVSDGWLAFEQEIDQHAYIAAASYSDCWTIIRDARGKVTGGVNSWYICRALTGPWDFLANKATPCFRITESKKWDTKFDDPLATGQRWYCSCGAKFAAKWGQVVETSTLDLSTLKVMKTYMKSDMPDWDAQDVRAMEMEESMAPRSAKALYEMVKAVKPALCEFIVKDSEGHHKLDGQEIFDALPVFLWKQLHNMTRKA